MSPHDISSEGSPPTRAPAEGGIGSRERGGGAGNANHPPPPPESSIDQDPSARHRCPRHAHLPDDDPGPNCLACRDTRLAAEAAAEQQCRANAEAVRCCRRCDNRGHRADDQGFVVRCDHQPEPDRADQDTGQFDQMRAAATSVPCSDCPAGAGQTCVDPDGCDLRLPAHLSRIRAAREEPAA